MREREDSGGVKWWEMTGGAMQFGGKRPGQHTLSCPTS